MKKQLLLIILALSVNLLFSQDIDRFCNSNACGDLDPNWELAGQTVVCEGEDFRLTPASSKTLSNISSYYWFIEDLRSNDVLFDTLFLDTTLLTYNYLVSDSLACAASSNVVSLQVRLVTLSPDCGGNQSCRFVAKPLTVFLKPRARFSNAPKVCVNEDIQLSNSSCHGEEYLWDFGDGTTSTEESPDKVFTTPGLYTIRLRVSNSCGDDFETRTIEVEGEPDAAFSFDSSDDDFCLPIIIDFANNSNEFSQTVWSISPFDTNRWRFTDTAMNLASEDISIRFLQEGTYTIKLNASNTCADADEQEEVIEIYQPINL
ncbi:MAG: PKD domain-containing protein, partial [Bacteroidota bacterium]